MPDLDRILDESQKRIVEDLHAGWHEAFSQGLFEAVIFDNEFKRLAWERFAQSPLSAVRCWLVRVPRLWYQDHIQMYAFLEPTGGYMMMLLTFCGIGLYHFPRRKVLLVATLPMYLALVCLPLHIESRFSVPTLPVLCVVGGSGVAKALQREFPSTPNP